MKADDAIAALCWALAAHGLQLPGGMVPLEIAAEGTLTPAAWAALPWDAAGASAKPSWADLSAWDRERRKRSLRVVGPARPPAG